MSGVCQAWTEDTQAYYTNSNEANAKSRTRIKKMDEQEDCTVWGALSLVMRLSKLAGVAPVKFEKGKDGVRMRISPCLSIWSYFMAFGLTTILLTSFILDMQLPTEHSVRVSTQMACTIWVIDLTIVLVLTDMGTCGATKRIKEMITCINSLNLIIRKLNNNRPFVQAERARCAFIITWVSGAIVLSICDMYTFVYEALYHENDKLVVAFNALYYIPVFTTLVLELQYIFVAMLIDTALNKVNGSLLDLLLDIDSKLLVVWLYVFYYFQVVLIVILELQCIFFAMSIPTAFKKLNEVLINLILGNDVKYVRRSKENNTEVNDASSLESLNLLHNLVTLMDKTNLNNFSQYLPPSRSAKSRISVHRLILAYTGICNIARQFYKSNGVLLITLLLSFLIHLVVTPYYFISYLFSVQENTGRKFGKYLQFVWCIHHATKIFSFMEPGHRIFEEMDRTKILIGQLMTRVDVRNEPLALELELFQRQITLNTINCSPLGMCVLTRPLIATVLSGLTTYFVIIIQFKSKETSH